MPSSSGFVRVIYTWAWRTYLCWTEGMWTLNYVHNAELTMQHLSSLFYLVTLKLNVKSELQAHSCMYNLSSILQQENLSSSVLQTLFFSEKVIDRERVNSTHSQFQSDDLQALCRTLWPQSIPHRANNPLNQMVESASSVHFTQLSSPQKEVFSSEI